MTAAEIRRRYIDFFTRRGHAEIPPAPIVPPDDPTTLFTSSGMQQLVPFLKGQAHPMGKRLVDAQPCFRAEDIDEVGDNRHTTFFEMLGNWSLGDYFKQKQLPWFFEFLTEEIDLDPNRLCATVFEGDAKIPRDEESIAIWQGLFQTNQPAGKGIDGFDPGIKIYTYGADKNWWSRAGTPAKMPPGEIGGPDSEVFYDFKTPHDPIFGKVCHLNCNCGRFLEIGNSVFMQYEKQEDGSFKPLPQKNVDFGGGLERIAAASQNTPDIFATDLFSEAIKTLEELHKDGGGYRSAPRPYRILADHARAAIFMVAAGLVPSNKGSGYILRRVIRRSMLYARELGMQSDEWSSNILPVLASPYAKTHTTVIEKIPQISETMTQEVDKFRKTLDRGLKEFEKYITLSVSSPKTEKRILDAKDVFNLYQSYGFPYELTKEAANKRNVEIPSKREFDQELEKHQQRSRTAGAGMFKGGLADKSQETVKLHTATHLLHQALREVLGGEVRQEGSHITAERLRFDFSHPKALTDEEVSHLEALINQKIQENLPVHKTIEEKGKALKSGALAFFKETYPEKVSVYTIGKDPNKNWFSKELCGGPHVKDTGEIGEVEIVKQQAVGTGIRRIYAVLHSSG